MRPPLCITCMCWIFWCLCPQIMWFSCLPSPIIRQWENTETFLIFIILIGSVWTSEDHYNWCCHWWSRFNILSQTPQQVIWSHLRLAFLSISFNQIEIKIQNGCQFVSPRYIDWYRHDMPYPQVKNWPWRRPKIEIRIDLSRSSIIAIDALTRITRWEGGARCFFFFSKMSHPPCQWSRESCLDAFFFYAEVPPA